jgi:4-hydroxymandelate oxidase
LSLPVLLAPVGFHRLAHAGGEVETAQAAAAAGTILVFSTAATISLEEVAQHAGAWWFQIYVFKDRELTRDIIQRAERAGASAVVVTVDTPLVGRREADLRNHFALPDDLTWANFAGSEYAFMSELAQDGSSLAAYISSSFESTLSWQDIDWLASVTSLPVIPKGILHPEDARKAVEHGAGSIIVSNHGGRQLDGAVASLDALPPIVESVGPVIEILLDGGVRRGTDVIKALALGARAVLIGRPYIWGLAVDGSKGVRHVLDLFGAELGLDMTLCDKSSIADINSSLLVPAAKGCCE